MRRAVLAAALACALAAGAAPAAASWSGSGQGSGSAKARQMPAGNVPSAAVSNREVNVSWTASSFSGGQPVDGYRVKRYDADGNAQSVGSNCSGTITALTCTETAVPAGTWRYAVVPRHGNNWAGAESERSSSVTVQSPKLSFSSATTITTLPTTLNGSISNFISGQTVTFRLDDPDTGTSLNGSITPSPVPGDGTATVEVTIPAGTSNGAHIVYAVGSAGDVAAAQISVDAPVARSLTTTSWSVSDVSSGSATNTSNFHAAADGRYDFQLGFQPEFDPNRYLDFHYNSPLRADKQAGSVSFKFNYLGSNAAGSAAAKTCFYVEVRRITNDNLLATHGSPTTPLDCVTSLSAFKQVSTALPEVDSTNIANDLKVRVFMSNAASGYVAEDLATLSGSSSSDPFTLYPTQVVNRATGTPTTTPWSLYAGGDGSRYTSNGSWSSSFSSSKHVMLTIPAYVPSTAKDISATFKHSYRSATAGSTSCFAFVVYEGNTAIATHGSSTSPISCNSSTSFTTDSVAIPSVNSVARANNLKIGVYMRNSASGKTEHDLAEVKIDYTG